MCFSWLGLVGMLDLSIDGRSKHLCRTFRGLILNFTVLQVMYVVKPGVLKNEKVFDIKVLGNVQS